MIPKAVWLWGSSGGIIEGPYKGQPHQYLSALLNVLIQLQPRVCLEIGTLNGDSAAVFKHYFARYQEGVLVTADIRKHCEIEGVRQVLVYPHSRGSLSRHSVQVEHLLPDWEEHIEESVDANCDILREELKDIGVDAFDFAFVDGDHAADSLRKDLEIVRRLVRPPHYALLDDTFEWIHESGPLYHEHLKHEYSHYDFEDWDVFVGASLVWA